MEPSALLHAVGYITAQTIHEKKRSIQGFASLAELLIPPLEFLVAVSAGIMAHLVCLYLFTLCLQKLLQKPKGSHLQVKVLAFFFLVFWFFIDQFYNGNLSTENITVKEAMWAISSLTLSLI